MKCYPVIIPTLNRYKHFKNCIESLAKCKYADQTELIIGLDYPAKESHFDGYLKIKNYLPSISGFSKVTIIERKENFGAVKNLQELINFAFKSNKAAILTEDDNYFAATFLEFINSSLEVFESNTDIISICGFTPSCQYNNQVDYLISPDASAWGVARWRDKDPLKNIDLLAFSDEILKSLNKSFKIFCTYPACLAMLMEMQKKGDIYGDTIRTAYNIIENKYQVKPAISLVRNMGQDGSGIHSGRNSKEFENQKLSNRKGYALNYSSNKSKCNYRNLLYYSLSSFRLKAVCSIFLIAIKYLKFRIIPNKYQVYID